MAKHTLCVWFVSAISLSFLLSEASFSAAADEQITIQTDAVATVSPAFLSVTIDAGDVRTTWAGFNMTLQRVVNMAKGLSPAVLRLGGSLEDVIIYVNHSLSHQEGFDAITMTFKQWDLINDFAKEVGWDLIFGLNARRRKTDGSWDPSNAMLLINYTVQKGYKVNWELGNEPDEYSHDVPAAQLAKDFVTLSGLLHQSDPDAILAGPDVTNHAVNENTYLKDFLDALSSEQAVPDVITWHQYYERGYQAHLEDFYNPVILDILMDELVKVKSFQSASNKEHVPVWLGETSSCSHGGAVNFSNTYVAAFMWLDKLGLAALYNYSSVCRQTFWGSSYGLLNSTTLEPQPDYWASLLVKQLVGQRVLGVEGQLQKGRTLRVYAFCTKVEEGGRYSNGAVTVLAMNLNASTIYVKFSGNLQGKDVDQYLMTPGDSILTSRSVALNGNPLHLVNEDIPPLQPIKITGEDSLRLPAHSYTFYVIPQADWQSCK